MPTKVVLGKSVLTDVVYAGRLTKCGTKWRTGQQHDVTSDFLRTIVEWVGVGKTRKINVGKKPKYSVSVTDITKNKRIK